MLVGDARLMKPIGWIPARRCLQDLQGGMYK
jgi:hypothetical protein